MEILREKKILEDMPRTLNPHLILVEKRRPRQRERNKENNKLIIENFPNLSLQIESHTELHKNKQTNKHRSSYSLIKIKKKKKQF